MQSHPSAPPQNLYPQGIAPVAGYAPPPQVAPGATTYAPPAQGTAPPPQGYVQQATGTSHLLLPQGYAQPGYAAPQPGYAAPPQGYVQPVVAPGQQPPTMESSSQGMGQAFDSVVGKVKKITLGGPSQPKTSIDALTSRSPESRFAHRSPQIRTGVVSSLPSCPFLAMIRGFPLILLISWITLPPLRA